MWALSQLARDRNYGNNSKQMRYSTINPMICWVRYLQHLLLNLDAAHERSFAAPVWPSVDLKKLWSNSAGAWHCHGGEENKHSVSLQHLGVVML